MNRRINLVVLHCSDSDRPEHDNIETIASWHKERGFSKVGYHFVILKNGDIAKGRDIDEVGAHVKGHNSHSIGICLTGREKFSPEQFRSLKNLLEWICLTYKLEDKDVLLHRELDNGKTCPNFTREDIAMCYNRV